MKLRGRNILLLLNLGLCGLCTLPQCAVAQRGGPASRPQSESCANSEGVATVRAPISTPYLNLRHGRTLGGGFNQTGQGRPLALASGDFDEDGMPDLVSGFGSGKGGTITVHRGNVAALWSYGAALRNGPPSAFLPDARVFAVPERRTFLPPGILTLTATGMSSLRSAEAMHSISCGAMGMEDSARRSAFPWGERHRHDCGRDQSDRRPHRSIPSSSFPAPLPILQVRPGADLPRFDDRYHRQHLHGRGQLSRRHHEGRPQRPKGTSLVDELIQERREAAKRE
jgi:hypothetical protein